MRSAMPWLERPSAISSSTSRSRGVISRRAGRRRRRRPEQLRRRSSGRATEPPAATRRIASAKLVELGDAVLEQVADALGAGRRAARSRSPTSTCWESTSTPTRGCAARIASAARRPSSVWVGGIRMSTIATSGGSRSTCSSSASAVAALGRPRRSPPRPAAARRPRAAASCRRPALPAWDLRSQSRAAARRAPHPQPAVERLDAVGEAAQPRAARRVGAADAVVGDLDHERRRPRAAARRSRSPPAAYLATLVSALGHEVVGGDLDRARAAARRSPRRARRGSGARAAQRLERDREAVVGEHRRDGCPGRARAAPRAPAVSSSRARLQQPSPPRRPRAAVPPAAGATIEIETSRCCAPSCRSRSSRRRSVSLASTMPRARRLQVAQPRAQLRLQALVLERDALPPT